ncbi:MAG: hypothetical protein IMZ64_04080 [Bacteroidetes bacterium]|nr:hypothetical protein [Bacteroidota bacterium]
MYTVIVLKDKEVLLNQTYREVSIGMNRKVTPEYKVGETKPLNMKIEPGSEIHTIKAQK